MVAGSVVISGRCNYAGQALQSARVAGYRQMNLAPLFSAGPVVAGHALMAVLAVAVGALQITLRKGTAMHRLFGAAKPHDARGVFWRLSGMASVVRGQILTKDTAQPSADAAALATQLV